MVACGDREDFLQLLRLWPSRGKAKGAATAKENLAEAGPLHEDELDFHYDWQDHRATMRLFVEKLAQRVLDLVFDE